MAYNCDQHTDLPAAFLLTAPETGDVVALCGDCTILWARAIVDSLEPDPAPEAPAAAIDPATGDETDEDGHADETPGPDPAPEAPSPAPDTETAPSGQGEDETGFPPDVVDRALTDGGTPTAAAPVSVAADAPPF